VQAEIRKSESIVASRSVPLDVLTVSNPFQSSIKNAIGKPYEGKLHSLPRIFGVRFDEGGADSLLFIATFKSINRGKLSGATLLAN